MCMCVCLCVCMSVTMTIPAQSLTSRTLSTTVVSQSLLSTLRLASFNVRGLASIIKPEQFGRDMKQCQVDACAVQETKIKDAEDFKLLGGATLHSFSQKEGDGGSRELLFSLARICYHS